MQMLNIDTILRYPFWSYLEFPVYAKELASKASKRTGYCEDKLKTIPLAVCCSMQLSYAWGSACDSSETS